MLPCSYGSISDFKGITRHEIRTSTGAQIGIVKLAPVKFDDGNLAHKKEKEMLIACECINVGLRNVFILFCTMLDNEIS